MRGFDTVEVERLLAMVDASARVVAPEEHEDLFEEFAEEFREGGVVPGADPGPVDDADTGIVDTHVFLGIGLTLLGQIAVKVVSVATDMALERGIREATAYVVKLFRGSDATADEAAATVTSRLPETPGIDEETLRRVVRAQLEAWARTDDPAA